MTTTPTTAMSPAEEQAFTVFLSATERYLDSVDAEAGRKFESWLDEHAEDEEMLAHLLQSCPKFGDIFADEIEKTGAATNAKTP